MRQQERGRLAGRDAGLPGTPRPRRCSRVSFKRWRVTSGNGLPELARPAADLPAAAQLLAHALRQHLDVLEVIGKKYASLPPCARRQPTPPRECSHPRVRSCKRRTSPPVVRLVGIFRKGRDARLSRVRKSDSSESAIESALPTTAYPARRNAVARPAPMPCEAPVMIATFCDSAMRRSLVRVSRRGRSRRSRLRPGGRRR